MVSLTHLDIFQLLLHQLLKMFFPSNAEWCSHFARLSLPLSLLINIAPNVQHATEKFMTTYWMQPISSCSPWRHRDRLYKLSSLIDERESPIIIMSPGNVATGSSYRMAGNCWVLAGNSVPLIWTSAISKIDHGIHPMDAIPGKLVGQESVH